MEAGGRCGDGAALTGVDGLIAVVIGGDIGTGDVGRQGHVAELFEQREKIVDRGEADAAFAERAAGEDFGAELIVFPEEEVLADTYLSAWANETFPIVGRCARRGGRSGSRRLARRDYRSRRSPVVGRRSSAKKPVVGLWWSVFWLERLSGI